MAVDTVAEHTEPEPGPYDPILEAHGNAALERWLPHHMTLVGEIEAILCAHLHLQDLVEVSQAEQAARNAEWHHATLATTLDPASPSVPGFAFDAALVVLLDAISLDWAAPAFDLDSAGGWVITFILVAASAPGMLHFEPTRRDARPSCLLAAVAAAVYLVLLELRIEFPAPIAGESLLVVLLQATTLIVISAVLVLVGSAMLARPGSLALQHRATVFGRTIRRPLTAP